MYSPKYMEQNLVELRGRVVHIYSKPNATILTIKTIYGSNVPNYPQITFKGKLAEKVKELKIGDNVDIEGFIKSRKFIEEIDGNEKITYLQSIRGINVNKTTEKSMNEVTVSGEIVKISECRDGVIMLVVKSRNGKKFSNVLGYLYSKVTKEILAHFNVGDKVEIKGNIQTKKRVYPDITRYYQDLTLRKIRKITE